MKKLAAALLLLAAPVFAGTPTVYDSISTFSTYHNISVRVYYHGDDDSDMTVSGGVTLHGVAPAGGLDTLTWFRSGKFGAQTGVTADTKTYWATSINMCGADSTFDLYVNVADADGCTSCPTDFTAKVTPTATPATVKNNTADRMVTLSGLAKQVWMSPFGSDANTGLSRTSPVLTFTKAASLMTTQGDQLRLMGNGTGTTIYYAMRAESLVVTADSKNGTGTKYYSVVGDTVGVTLSGADTTALDASGWIATDIGITVPVVRYAYVHSFATNPCWPRVIVLGDSLRLYPYKRLNDLVTDPLSVVASVGAYWFSNDGKVLIMRPPDKLLPHGETLGGTLFADADPSLLKNKVRVAIHQEAIRIESSFWRVDSLAFQDYGVGRDIGISLATVNLANQGNVVENCAFNDLGRPGVGIRAYFDATLLRTHWNTIQLNTFTSHTLGQTWSGPSNHLIGYDKMAGTFPTCQGAFVDTNCYEEMVVFPQIIVETGRGHVIRWNRFNGGSDATVRASDLTTIPIFAAPADTSALAINSMDIYQNQMLNCGDDTIEPDAIAGVNCRVYRNMMLGGATAMNWSITRGPFWFMLNTCINQRDAMLPVGNTPSNGQGVGRGHLIIANNTFATRCTNSADFWNQSQGGDHNSYVNVHVINNLISSAGLRTIWEGGCLQANEFNWNIHHRTADTTFDALVKYSTGRDLTSLKAWRDSTYGYGANDGRTLALQFSDSTNWDWAPKSTWTEILGKLNARSLPGINTNTLKHVSPAWKVNTSGSSDSTYVGAWKVNGYRLETNSSGGAGSAGSFRRRPHRTEEEPRESR